MAKPSKTSVPSYFLLFDFYHNKKTTEAEAHYLLESMIYFYPNGEEVKIQKELEWRQMIGLILYLNQIYSSSPKEIFFKNSLIKIQNYGRHSAFLILPRDRFTVDEADIHLQHILEIFHTLYGSLNHIQATHSNIAQMTSFLRVTLTPIVEHVFSENRSIRNLFSVVNYSPVKKAHQLSLLSVKHFLYNLKKAYEIEDCFFALDRRILHSTFDIDITHCIQVILCSPRLLPMLESSNSSRIDFKLRKGVSLLTIHLLQSPDLPTVNTMMNDSNEEQNPTKPILINRPLTSDTLDQSVFTYTDISKLTSSPFTPDAHRDPIASSEDITDFDTDHTGYTSARSKNDETDSLLSYSNADRLRGYSRNIISGTKEESAIDSQGETASYDGTNSYPPHRHSEESSRSDNERFLPRDPSNRMTFQSLISDLEMDDSIDCQPSDILVLPKTIRPDYSQTRRRTITSDTLNEPETQTNVNDEQFDPPMTWENIPETNNELEREEFILYIQRNARLTFAGLIKRRILSDTYLKELWLSLLSRMADLDQSIQAIPFAGESSKQSTDIKFQFNHNMRQAQYERLIDGNKFYYKVPSSEGACMALHARKKMNIDPERRMIGLSQGNNSITITSNLPDRETYIWRQFQETR